MQADSLDVGLVFVGKHAEVVFIAAHGPEVARSRIKHAREAAAKAERDPKSVKVLALLCPVVGRTDEQARQKDEEYMVHSSDDGALALFRSWTGMDLSPYGDHEELRAAINWPPRALRSRTFRCKSGRSARWRTSLRLKF